MLYDSTLSEEWRPVEECPAYEVSSLGRVRMRGLSPKNHKPRILRPKTDRYGYLVVCLYTKERNLHRTVHRLVAKAFVPGDAPQVNHKDLDKTNNTVPNLEWMTNRENHAHFDASGRRSKGERHPRAILTEADVLHIRSFPPILVSNAKLAAQYGVSKGTIESVRSGRNWRHVIPPSSRFKIA